MMTDRADGAGGPPSSVRLSSENASNASDDGSLGFPNLDTRKRKEASYGGLDAADQNKRVKHEPSEYSGASFDTRSNFLADQGTSAEERGAPGADTSFRSTDNDNTGDDEYSRCDTSAFNSGEEGFSQRDDTRHIPAFKQSQSQRDDYWEGERNLLQLQLGSFIQKEKEKLESESEAGCSGYALSGSLRGYESIESVTGVPDDRYSGNNGSLSGFLRGSSSFAESSENTGYGGEIYSSRSSSVLSSKKDGFKKDESREELASLANIVRGVSWPSFSSARPKEQVYETESANQKFVLSSGRPSNVTAAREDTRENTIDRDFDDYFAKLML